MSSAIHEQEFEQELEMAALGEGEFEQEWESSPEFETHEGSPEHEAEFEAEQFFGGLARLAARAVQSPALRKIGLQAARSALSGLGGLLDEQEGEGEFEGEGEAYALHEGEGEISPIRKVYPDAMMEHMAHMAAMAETEHEAAEHFLPLVPLVASKLAPLAAKAVGKAAGRLAPHAAKLAPRVISNVMKVAPTLTKGIGKVTRSLFRNPRTRPLVRVIPTIARRATAQIARTAARGRTVTPLAARRILAKQTARTICRAGECVRAYRRGRNLDRRLHSAFPGVRRGVGYSLGARPRSSPGVQTIPWRGYPYRRYAQRYGPGYVVQSPSSAAPISSTAAAAPRGRTHSCNCQCNCRCPTCGR